MDNEDEEKQIQRTLLRERFLRFLTSIKDVPTEFVLCNNMVINAKFGSSDVDIQHFQVSDLQTPIGQQPAAILRTTDIVSATLRMPCTVAKPVDNNLA